MEIEEGVNGKNTSHTGRGVAPGKKDENSKAKIRMTKRALNIYIKHAD